MTAQSETMIRALFASDNTITPDQTKQVFAILLGNAPREIGACAILSRQQVANIIGKSLQTVDIYARKGIFKRVSFVPSDTTISGRQRKQPRRAAGISRESVESAIRAGVC